MRINEQDPTCKNKARVALRTAAIQGDKVPITHLEADIWRLKSQAHTIKDTMLPVELMIPLVFDPTLLQTGTHLLKIETASSPTLAIES